MPAYLIAALVAALVGLAIMHGVVILLPIVASPLYACHRQYYKRWTQTSRLTPSTAPVAVEA
jgi:hypothetical protein